MTTTTVSQAARHVALDPSTGLVIRPATTDEIKAYTAAVARRPCCGAVRMGAVSIDQEGYGTRTDAESRIDRIF